MLAREGTQEGWSVLCVGGWDVRSRVHRWVDYNALVRCGVVLGAVVLRRIAQSPPPSLTSCIVWSTTYVPTTTWIRGTHPDGNRLDHSGQVYTSLLRVRSLPSPRRERRFGRQTNASRCPDRLRAAHLLPARLGWFDSSCLPYSQVELYCTVLSWAEWLTAAFSLYVMHGGRPCDIHAVWWHDVHASCQALWTAARCRGSGDMLLVSQARWGVADDGS